MKQSRITSLSLLAALHQSRLITADSASNNEIFIGNTRKRRLRGQSQNNINNPLGNSHLGDLHNIQQQQHAPLNTPHSNNNSRNLQKLVTPQYLTQNPWYPHHDSLKCLSDGNMPNWMTWQGGYAEAHLFATKEECCERWFPELEGCLLDDANEVEEDGEATGGGGEGDMVSNMQQIDVSESERPAADNANGGSNFDQLTIVERPLSDASDSSTGPHASTSGYHETETEMRPATVISNSQKTNDMQANTHQVAEQTEETYPTSSCGTGWSTASSCTILCLNGLGCPAGQECYPGVACPASQVATAMGNAGSSILDMIDASAELRASSMSTNVCGESYSDAESKCQSTNDDGEVTLGFSEEFVECPSGAGCPNGMHCYGGILCPLPPTISPQPTRSPVVQYEVNHSAEGHGKSIVAYYASSRYHDRSKLAQPRNLNYELVTRINYAHFQVNEEGLIWGTDENDATILFGDVANANPTETCAPNTLHNGEGCHCHRSSPGVQSCNYHNEQNGLIHLAHEKGVEVYVSIGGWTNSGPFREMAGSREGREKFAEGCIGLLLEYGFDGIDIDWEFPGSDDTDNFVLLLQTLRSALDALGSQTNKRYGLTAALPCGPSNIANQAVPDVSEVLDELNLMTYDFHGSWDATTGHNAPLYDSPNDEESGWSVNGCVENWVGGNSPPDPKKGDIKKDEHRSKVNIGLPFYGRSYLDTTEMYTAHGGSDVYSWYEDDGTPQYYNIVEKLQSGEMTLVRDDEVKVPYAYFNDGYGMVSYDDERSICDKTEYAVENGLGGFVIWDITGDMMDDFHQPLLESLNRKLALPDTDCEEVFGTTVEIQASDPQVSSKTDAGVQVETTVLSRPVVEIEEQLDLIVAPPEPTVEEPLERGDKTEVVGIPIVAPPAPRPAPVSAPLPSPDSGASPYTIDKSSFGQLSVAAESCQGGCPSNSRCVGNSASGQVITDEECKPCNAGQTWWPCDLHGLCWCWADDTDRIAPAPASAVEVQVDDPYYTVCDDILSREMFDIIAPDARAPYTYEGLCDAILSYNARHTEKIFGMGDAFQRTAELAAFLGNTLHESDEFRAGREYLMCADNLVVGGETYCKPCDPGSFDWSTKKCAHSLISGTSDFNEYCQPQSKPPEACLCGNGSGEAGGQLEGYVAAKHLFFGRGAIQLSWNYNYLGASVALTGSEDTFCNNPDVVATEPKYAWGAGVYFWMEHVKEESTSHMQAMSQDFGGTLNNINGGLECPAHGGWHVDAVKARLNRYCRAATALGLPNLMKLDGCAGLDEAMDTCLIEGKCDDCQAFVGSTPGKHLPTFVPLGPAPVISTPIEQVVEFEAPLCPEGLMAWDENPECCVPNSNFVGDGACDPEAPYNTAACGYDGGDCCKETCNANSAFGCTTKEGDNFDKYGPFGYYCIDPSQGESVINSPLCGVDQKYRISDGMCNPMYNTPECNYDGGDCCEETCDDIFGFYPCGSGVQSFLCLDPRFNIATNPPTNHPTTSPTGRPVEESSPKDDYVYDENDILAMICPMDMLECPGGGYMGRNAQNNCQFDPCPEELPEATVCKTTLKECSDGSYVGQDPDDNCEYLPCPEIPQQQSSNASKNSLASSISSVMHGKNNVMQEDDSSETPKPTSMPTQKPTCEDDVRECAGGGFIGRDPSNGCKFLECPGPIQSLASSITSSFSQNSAVPKCTDEVKICPNGSFVGKDPDNNCEFFECESSQESQPMAASISQAFGQQVATAKDCADDLKRCSDGSFVARDANNDCAWFDCPIKPLSASISQSFGQEASTQTQEECNSDVKRCPDGSFVTRDPNNGCDHFPCGTREPTMITFAGAVHNKYNAKLQCENDLLECHDGHFVGRDPDADCAYYPCPPSIPTQGEYELQTLSGIQQCDDDLFRCSDGSFVGRDVDKKCEFFGCPSEGANLEIKKMSQVMNTNTGQDTSSRHRKKNSRSR